MIRQKVPMARDRSASYILDAGQLATMASNLLQNAKVLEWVGLKYFPK
jgi:hypothetical protein